MTSLHTSSPSSGQNCCNARNSHGLPYHSAKFAFHWQTNADMLFMSNALPSKTFRIKMVLEFLKMSRYFFNLFPKSFHENNKLPLWRIFYWSFLRCKGVPKHNKNDVLRTKGRQRRLDISLGTYMQRKSNKPKQRCLGVWTTIKCLLGIQ